MKAFGWLKQKKGRAIRDITLENLVETSITLDYQSDKWGIARMALDGVQNHLPADSKGTRIDVDFFINDEWIPRSAYQNGNVSAIRISDNGKGYPYELLGVLYSTKKTDSKAVGEFGEGIKMISAAALREGVDLELRSREWCARPTALDLNIEDNHIQKLVYKINQNSKIRGSQTIFWNPSRELVEYIKRLDEKVLLLREGFEPIYKRDRTSVLDTRGDIFVKGIYITSAFKDRLIFSYDLDIKPNRDRDNVREDDLSWEVGRIWSLAETPAPIKALLQMYQANPQKFANSHELCALVNNGNSLNQEVWKKAFGEVYGSNAVIKTEGNVGTIAENLGYKVVNIENHQLRFILKNLGIPADVDVLEGGDDLLFLFERFDISKIKRDVKSTSLTTDYRARNWDKLRIVLDSIANHMPQDTGGSNIKIEYLVQKNYDLPFGETWTQSLAYNATPKAIRISDDGKGYSLDRLLLLNSNKSEEAVGQFGEGLKMLSTACLREEIPVKFRSRDWFAMPMTSTLNIDGDLVDRLDYKTVEGADQINGSQTTFYNPPSELLVFFRSIGDYVLHFAPNISELHREGNERIIEPKDRQATYVKGFFIRGNKSGDFRSIFSYDIDTKDIAVDRNNIDYQTLRDGVKRLLETCKNENVVAKILEAADKKERGYIEYMALDLHDEAVRNIWKDAFAKVFGNHAVLSSTIPAWDYEAQHLGYKLVHMDEILNGNLLRADVPTSAMVAAQNYSTIDVKETELTNLEKTTLALLPKVDNVLDLKTSVKINVFSAAADSRGEDPGFNGFYNGNVINLRRSVLSSPKRAIQVYTHERGHHETSAPDPDDNFRMFFEYHLLPFVLREIDHPQGRLDRDSRPFDYDLALKEARTLLQQYRIAKADAAKAEEGFIIERKKLEGSVHDKLTREITYLQNEVHRLKVYTGNVDIVPWYKRMFRLK